MTIKYGFNDDKTIATFSVDGYSWGDRTLEGAIFVVEVSYPELQTLSFELHPQHSNNKYFDGLNMQYWIQKGKLFVEDTLSDLREEESSMIEEIFGELKDSEYGDLNY